MNTIPDITRTIESFRRYGDYLKVVTAEELGSEIIYKKFVKNITEAKTFNYHSDYWGSADGYQDDNVEVMYSIKPYIGKKVIINDEEVKLIGMLIDRQYNSLGHTCILVEN